MKHNFPRNYHEPAIWFIITRSDWSQWHLGMKLFCLFQLSFITIAMLNVFSFVVILIKNTHYYSSIKYRDRCKTGDGHKKYIIWQDQSIAQYCHQIASGFNKLYFLIACRNESISDVWPYILTVFLNWFNTEFVNLCSVLVQNKQAG